MGGVLNLSHCTLSYDMRSVTKVTAEIFSFYFDDVTKKRESSLYYVPEYENETKRTRNIMLETTSKSRIMSVNLSTKDKLLFV